MGKARLWGVVGVTGLGEGMEGERDKSGGKSEAERGQAQSGKLEGSQGEGESQDGDGREKR